MNDQSNQKQLPKEMNDDPFAGLSKAQLLKLAQENNVHLKKDMSDEDIRAALRGAHVGEEKVVVRSDQDPARFGGQLSSEPQSQTQVVTAEAVDEPEKAKVISQAELESANDRRGRANLGR